MAINSKGCGNGSIFLAKTFLVGSSQWATQYAVRAPLRFAVVVDVDRRVLRSRCATFFLEATDFRRFLPSEATRNGVEKNKIATGGKIPRPKYTTKNFQEK